MLRYHDILETFQDIPENRSGRRLETFLSTTFVKFGTYAMKVEIEISLKRAMSCMSWLSLNDMGRSAMTICRNQPFNLSDFAF